MSSATSSSVSCSDVAAYSSLLPAVYDITDARTTRARPRRPALEPTVRPEHLIERVQIESRRDERNTCGFRAGTAQGRFTLDDVVAAGAQGERRRSADVQTEIAVRVGRDVLGAD